MWQTTSESTTRPIEVREIIPSPTAITFEQTSPIVSINKNDPVKSFAIVDDFPVTNAWRMAFSPDGEQLYVLHRPLLESNFQVSVVEVPSYEISQIITLGPGYGMALAPAPNGEKIYVTISEAIGQNTSWGENRIDIIDTKTFQVTNSLPVQGHQFGPTAIVFWHNGQKAYVSHRGANLVYVIDIEREVLIGQIPVGTKPTNMAVTRDDNRVYVVNGPNSTVAVIDTAIDRVIQSIPSSLEATSSYAFIALTPDGREAYVVHRDDPVISVIDTDATSPTYHQITGRIPTSSTEFRNITVTPDGKYVLAASPSSGIIIIDVDPTSATYHNQVGSISIGYAVGYIIFHPSRSEAYVLGEGDTITVLAYTPTP